jgi:hypothetical protein
MIGALFIALTTGAGPAVDVRVDGDGYLRFAQDARVVYAAKVKLVVHDGKIETSDGAGLLPPIDAPGSLSSLTVDLQGNVIGTTTTGNVTLGRLVLAIFPQGTSMTQASGFLTASVRPSLGNPGEDTNGVIRTGEDAKSAEIHHQTSPKRDPEVIKPVMKPKTDVDKGSQESTDWKGAPQIIVSQTTEISTEQFTLADVAQIHAKPALADQLSKIVLGDSPAAGLPRALVAPQILSKIRQAGIDPTGFDVQIPIGSTIKRASQVVTVDQWSSAAIGAVEKSLGTDVPMTADVSSVEFRAPLGQLELRIENCVQAQMTYTVTVAVFVDGKRFNSRIIRVTPDSSAICVKANQDVTISMACGGASVECTGKTRTAGFVGQTVTVATSDGTVMTATVVDATHVKVKL